MNFSLIINAISLGSESRLYQIKPSELAGITSWASEGCSVVSSIPGRVVRDRPCWTPRVVLQGNYQRLQGVKQDSTAVSRQQRNTQREHRQPQEGREKKGGGRPQLQFGSCPEANLQHVSDSPFDFTLHSQPTKAKCSVGFQHFESTSTEVLWY